jgi:molecular chaperone GrpE
MKIPIFSDDDADQGKEEPSAASEAREGSSEALAEAAVSPAAEESTAADVRLQELAAALAQKTREYDATREQLLRLMADFDNYRKRMTRQSEEARQYGMAEVVMSLLPGFDNLERAVSAARQDQEAIPSATMIAEGVSMVLRQFKEALAKIGVREVQTQSLPFDPTRHEAVDIVAVPASEDGMIVGEVQRGYLLGDRLLRPAKVVVGKAARDANPEGA